MPNRCKNFTPLAERLSASSMLIDTGCIIWTKYINKTGYGVMGVFKGSKKYTSLAHRVAYELVHGPIPENKIICHKCDVRSCINVDHLFIGTHKDNSDDKINKRRGKWLSGNNNKNIKIFDSVVVDIFLSQGSQSSIAKNFGVSQQLVSRIKCRQYRQHLLPTN